MVETAKPDQVKVDVVVRSYSKDFCWLVYCLSAYRKYAHGFRDVILVVPKQSVTRLQRYEIQPDRLVVCNGAMDDYLGQQVTKLYADLLTDADFIMHLDSDCILRKPCSPQELLDGGGRPVLLITPLSRFRRGGPSQAVTEKFLGHAIAQDYIGRQPLLYPRWLYKELRDFALKRFGQSLAQYVVAQGPLGFSEFNALGAYADRFHHSEFDWQIHLSDHYDERFARVFWSWGGITPETLNELRAICGLTQT